MEEDDVGVFKRRAFFKFVENRYLFGGSFFKEVHGSAVNDAAGFQRGGDEDKEK